MPKNPNNRRGHYRVTPTFERAVRIELVRDGGTSVLVGLVDISSGGCGVAVPDGALPMLQDLEVVTLRFTSERLVKPLEINAEVRHTLKGTTATRYGLAFEDWLDSRQKLGPKLRRLFNEREAFRVEPEPGERLFVHLTTHHSSNALRGEIRDVSVLGLGLWLREEASIMLERGDHVMVEFTLPVSPDVLRCTCEVRHIERESTMARRMIGVHILEERTSEYANLKRVLTDYVMDRQMVIRRKGSF